jgi:hypothetical protein
MKVEFFDIGLLNFNIFDGERDNHENYINETRIMLNFQLSHYFLRSFFYAFTEYIPHIRYGPSLIDVIKIDRSEWGRFGSRR